jgi:transposase-like protein
MPARLRSTEKKTTRKQKSSSGDDSLPGGSERDGNVNSGSRTRLSPEDRLRILNRVYIDRISVAQACREFGISRFTFYKLQKRYLSGASYGTNLQLLSDRYRSRQSHYRQVSSRVEREVLGLVRKNPKLSTHQLASKVAGIGNHGVQGLLKKLSLQTRKDREVFSRLSDGEFEDVLRLAGIGLRQFASPEKRMAVVRRVVDNGEKVSDVCRNVGISRFTFYKWLKLYKKQPSLEGLENRWVSGRRHYRAISEVLERSVLDEVVANPQLSSHKLAEKISEIGNHGVQNVLLRNDLNTFEKRLEYVQVRLLRQQADTARQAQKVRPDTGHRRPLRA